MKYSFKPILAAVVALSAFVGAAKAADLPPIVPPPPPPVETVVEYGSGWYLRGDIGYDIAKADPSLYQSAPVVNLFGESMDSSWSFGIGAGYQFNSWFRADLTAEYRLPENIHAWGPCACVGNTSHNVDIESWVFLANGYVDLGTWRSITPYVGAGIGWARHEAGTFLNDGTVIPPSGVTSLSGNTDWTFVYALMAGAAVDISPNMKLDFGYRYIDLGSARSGTLTNLGTTAPRIVYDDMAAHELRIGLRYMFDTGYDYAPIAAKY
ncbi:MAG: outer membrane protein [Flavobacteriaceae bacterium]